MKRHSIFNIKAIIFVVASLALVGLFAAGIFAIGGLLGGLAGTSLAMASPAGTTTNETSTTETIASGSSELLQNTISKRITELKPSANPLDTIMRELGGAEQVKSWEYEWYYIDQKGTQDTIKTAFSASGGSSAVNTVYDLYVNNIHIWNVDDVAMFVDIVGASSKPLIVHVVDKVPSAFKLVVLPLNGTGTNGYDMPLIAQSKKLVRIGNAKSEKDAQTTPYAAYPQKDSNYCQIHMAQVEESIYAALHDKEVQWNINDHKMQALYDLRRSMESTSLWGTKKFQFDPIGQDNKYFSAGITQYISKGLEYASTGITNAVFAGWGKDIFTGNSGSEKRILFTGGNLMKTLLSTPTIVKQIEAKSTEVIWGITFKKIDTGFGELLVKYHPLFDYSGWEDKGLVLDVNYIDKVVFNPMKSTDLELIKTGQKNAKAQVIQETFCLATRYPDLHAIISKTS